MLPAGPTVVDTMANAAFYFGLVRALAEHERPLWSQMSFSAAEENFHVAARQGIEAKVYWPGLGQVRATELVVRRLLPLARAGLDGLGRRRGGERPAASASSSSAASPAPTARRGSPTSFHARARDGDGSRLEALRGTLNEYRERDAHQRAGAHLGAR